jgi:hypothetical protein
MLEDAANEILFSHAAVWEMLNKNTGGGVLDDSYRVGNRRVSNTV